MKFQINLECDGCAFTVYGDNVEYNTRTETARILRDVANQLDLGNNEGIALDYYGNRVGTFNFHKEQS